MAHADGYQESSLVISWFRKEQYPPRKFCLERANDTVHKHRCIYIHTHQVYKPNTYTPGYKDTCI